MTPLSCNCLSRPAPSLVILCSEPTRRSPGIVSCSGSHQPVQTLTHPPPPPLRTHTHKTPFTPHLLSSVMAGAAGAHHQQCHWLTLLISTVSSHRRRRAPTSSSTAMLTVNYISTYLHYISAQHKPQPQLFVPSLLISYTQNRQSVVICVTPDK